MKKTILAALSIAGLFHLFVTPLHFFLVPAHGVFLFFVGSFQICWVLVFWRRSLRPLNYLVGLLLSGGMVWIWVLTQVDSTPFSPGPPKIDWPVWIIKGAEIVAFVALLILKYQAGVPKRTKAGLIQKGKGRKWILVRGPIGTFFFAVFFLVIGLIGEKKFPQFGPRPTAQFHGEGYSYQRYTWADIFYAARMLIRDFSAEESYQWDLPKGFPVPRVPPENAMTAEKVELGRHLFYDQRLSANQEQACASCHEQNLAFSDGKVVAVGSTGQSHPRNSLSLANVVYNSTYTWANAALLTLEQQIRVPMFGETPIELGITGHEEEILQRFSQDALYGRLFADAFPNEEKPVHFDNIIKALASFSRTLVSGNAPYDRYVYQKDLEAMSSSALRGMDLFFSERLECHHCHGGFNLTLSAVHRGTTFIEKPFHNTGLYNVDGKGGYPKNNTGLYEISGEPKDMGRFRAPTLRNISLTAPYMHDGSIATLEEVIRIYEAGGRNVSEGQHQGDGRENPLKSGFVLGFSLTDQERLDLLAFLESLSDPDFLTEKRFANPFEVQEDGASL